jgi:hypothetical protein
MVASARSPVNDRVHLDQRFQRPALKSQHPRRLETCALRDKRSSRPTIAGHAIKPTNLVAPGRRRSRDHAQ